MKRTVFFVVLVFVVSVFFNSSVYSQDDNMKKWMEYMTPGDMHKMLASHSGKWSAKTTFWMAPGTDPVNSEATAEGEMILDGRYLVSKYKGNMMGTPFEGIAVEGFDNAVKMFMSTWIDNMGTGIMYMTGKWDEATKQINYSGKAVDPMSGGWIDIRQVVKFNADGTTTMEMYGPDSSGKEFKTMEIIYSR